MKTEVLSKLGVISDDNLEAVLTSLDLTVSTERRKKDKAVFNAIVRYLTSEAVEDLQDEGLSIFLKLKDELTTMIKDEEKEKDDVKPVDVKPVVSTDVENVVKSEEIKPKNTDAGMCAGEEKSKAAGVGMTRVEYHRVKDFRIEGGTVCGTLTYRNVQYQMEKGRELGHSETEVMTGVIKAMKPGVLRTYCETSGTELNYKELCELLQSYSGVENATLMLTRLHNSFQGDEYAENKDQELEVDFLLRLGALRKTVLKLAKEEGAKLDDEMVSSSFRHALSVGIRRDVIRLQVNNILIANETIPDRELLRKVQLIMSMDKENQKTKGQGSAGVNHVYLDNKPQHLARKEDIPRLMPQRSEQDSKLDTLILELQSVNVNIDQERKDRRSDMDELRNRLDKLERKAATDDNRQDGSGQGNSKRKFIPKCQNCEQQNLYCNHCAKCGEGGHKQRECTKNP